jgi:predicted RNA binding protein YcfA (HicA-like mRNA interferase family)
MKYRDLIREPERNGRQPVRSKGSHRIYQRHEGA